MASLNQQNPPELRTISDFKNNCLEVAHALIYLKSFFAFPTSSPGFDGVLEKQMHGQSISLPASNVPLWCNFQSRILRLLVIELLTLGRLLFSVMQIFLPDCF